MKTFKVSSTESFTLGCIRVGMDYTQTLRWFIDTSYPFPSARLYNKLRDQYFKGHADKREPVRRMAFKVMAGPYFAGVLVVKPVGNHEFRNSHGQLIPGSDLDRTVSHVQGYLSLRLLRMA